MSHDGLSRGVPVQHLPENQDPEVQFMLEEVTGKITPLAAFLEEEPPHPPPSDEKPAKGKKRAAATKAADPAPSLEEASSSDPGAGE